MPTVIRQKNPSGMVSGQSERPDDNGTEMFLSLVDSNFNPRTGGGRP
jgi:hypothetical protein